MQINEFKAARLNAIKKADQIVICVNRQTEDEKFISFGTSFLTGTVREMAVKSGLIRFLHIDLPNKINPEDVYHWNPMFTYTKHGSTMNSFDKANYIEQELKYILNEFRYTDGFKTYRDDYSSEDLLTFESIFSWLLGNIANFSSHTTNIYIHCYKDGSIINTSGSTMLEAANKFINNNKKRGKRNGKYFCKSH